MSTPNSAILASRSVVSIVGPDAPSFLNGLVSCNTDNIAGKIAGYGALLTPQGKILFDFFIMGQADGYLLDCSSAQRDDLIKRLTFYKLRAELDIFAKPEFHVIANWNEVEHSGSQTFIDPRTPDMGTRSYGHGTGKTGNEAEYHAHRIALGLADSDNDIGSGELFPHEANLDQFGGVDFQKGCYVGQEVVSRMQHRANVRKRILPVSSSSAALSEGSAVTGGGKPVGQLLSVSSHQALALLRLDRVQSAFDAGEPIESAGVQLNLHKPAWAHFDLPMKGTA